MTHLQEKKKLALNFMYNLLQICRRLTCDKACVMCVPRGAVATMILHSSAVVYSSRW